MNAKCDSQTYRSMDFRQSVVLQFKNYHAIDGFSLSVTLFEVQT